MIKGLKKLIAFLAFFIVSSSCQAQVSANLTTLEKLLVNIWKLESVVIDDKDIPLTKTQQEGRHQFLANHTSKQLYDDLTENGNWILDEKNMTISIRTDLMPDEAVLLKIIDLREKKLVFSIINSESNQNIVFSFTNEGIN